MVSSLLPKSSKRVFVACDDSAVPTKEVQSGDPVPSAPRWLALKRRRAAEGKGERMRGLVLEATSVQMLGTKSQRSSTTAEAVSSSKRVHVAGDDSAVPTKEVQSGDPVPSGPRRSCRWLVHARGGLVNCFKKAEGTLLKVRSSWGTHIRSPHPPLFHAN